MKTPGWLVQPDPHPEMSRLDEIDQPCEEER